MEIKIENKIGLRECFFCKNKENKLVGSMINAPLVLGCIQDSNKENSFVSFNIWQCKNCELVFTDAEINEDAYSTIHSEAVGKIWSIHHEAFKKFVDIKNLKKILEIGPSNNPTSRNNTVFIDMFEKTPFVLSNSEKYLKGRFPFLNLEEKFDKIIASHVFEHAEEPELFLKKCKELLKPEGVICLSIPNFELWINKKYWNAITSEHQIYPTIIQIKKLCKDLNLKVEFEKFRDHSIFLKIKFGTSQNNIQFVNSLKIEEWFNSIIKSIKSVENEISNTKIKEVILVGASHISQYPLLMSKIIEEKTLYVLDNSKSKHEHRLYGTKIVCKSFEIIKEFQNPKIIIFNSPYFEEMKSQIMLLNKNSQIIYSS